MAVVEHIVTYYAKNFDSLVSLVECFVDSSNGATISSFQAEIINNEWRAIVVYKGDFADYNTVIVTTVTRIQFQYDADLQQIPLKSNYQTWLNDEEIFCDSLVLLGGSEILRLTFPNPTFASGDKVEVSFCNTQGMNVSTVICASFGRSDVTNSL